MDGGADKVFPHTLRPRRAVVLNIEKCWPQPGRGWMRRREFITLLGGAATFAASTSGEGYFAATSSHARCAADHQLQVDREP